MSTTSSSRHSKLTQTSFEERVGSDDIVVVQAALDELSQVIAGLVLAGDAETALKRLRWLVQAFLSRVEALPGLTASIRYSRMANVDPASTEKIVATAGDELRRYVDAIAQFNPLMIGTHTAHLPPEIPSWAFGFERRARDLGDKFHILVFGSHERWRSLCQQKTYLPRR